MYFPTNVVHDILRHVAIDDPVSAGAARTACKQWRDARPLVGLLVDAYRSDECIDRAVRGGRVDVLDALIDGIEQGEVEFPWGVNPQLVLHTAASCGSIEMCAKLLDKKATWGFMDTYFEEHGVMEDVMWTYPIIEDAFHAALYSDQIEVAEYLFPKITDMYEGFYDDCLKSACVKGAPSLCEMIVAKMVADGTDMVYICNVCMVTCARYGHAELAEMFFGLGAKPLFQKNAALRCAVTNDDLAMARTLMNKNRFGKQAAKPSIMKSCILTEAAVCGSAEMCKLLVEHGADPTADKSIALEKAVYNNHLKTVEALLELGASVEHVVLPNLDMCELVKKKQRIV